MRAAGVYTVACAAACCGYRSMHSIMARQYLHHRQSLVFAGQLLKFVPNYQSSGGPYDHHRPAVPAAVFWPASHFAWVELCSCEIR